MVKPQVALNVDPAELLFSDIAQSGGPASSLGVVQINNGYGSDELRNPKVVSL